MPTRDHLWTIVEVRLDSFQIEVMKAPEPSALSEETAHPTVYDHLSQVSVDNQLSGLAKCREDSGVQMPLSQVIFCSLAWIYLSPLS